MGTQTINEFLPMKAWQIAMEAATASTTWSAQVTAQTMEMVRPALTMVNPVLAMSPAWYMLTAHALAVATATAMATSMAVAMPVAMAGAMAETAMGSD
ncbi:MAG: hypothetical protein FWG14_11665 [Peptococcaceae bacterium]|nr:hypothetical protein [Peptococcaceae bacterium]